MKYLLPVLCLILTIQVVGQDNKWKFGFDYNPGITKTVAPVFSFEPQTGFQLGHSGFFKADFAIAKNLELTGGLGYLNARNTITSHVFQFGEGGSHLLLTHHYLMIPLGLKYSIGSFFIQPEIGFGYNIGNTTIQRSIGVGGNNKVKWNDPFNNDDNYKFTSTLFLTIGQEVQIGKTTVLYGIKGHRSLRPIAPENTYPNGVWYFGLSLMTGVRF